MFWRYHLSLWRRPNKSWNLTQKRSSTLPTPVLRCRQKFLRFFTGGFYDETYVDWERDYKWQAHQAWNETLDRQTHRDLISKKDFTEIAARAVRIESRTNLLFSFEKMALRDAVKSSAGARKFAEGLYEFLYGTEKFGREI